MAKYDIFTVMFLMNVIVNGWMHGAVDGLRMDYYILACPVADLIIKNTVNRHLQKDPTLAASLVRMHFHDCFIQVRYLSFFL